MSLRFKVIPQSDCVVVLGVVRAVKQGYSAVSSGLQNRFEVFFVPLELDLITTLELCPLLAIVTEPLSKLRTGRNIFQPDSIGKGRLLHTPRPQSLDEKLLAIIVSPRFIYALQLDHLSTGPNRKC
jgi:hypothetical protein